MRATLPLLEKNAPTSASAPDAVEAYRESCEALETGLLEFFETQNNKTAHTKEFFIPDDTHTWAYLPDSLHTRLVACCSDAAFMTALLGAFYASQTSTHTKTVSGEFAFRYRADAGAVAAKIKSDTVVSTDTHTRTHTDTRIRFRTQEFEEPVNPMIAFGDFSNLIVNEGKSTTTLTDGDADQDDFSTTSSTSSSLIEYDTNSDTANANAKTN